MGRTPFGSGAFVLTEHAFARTRHIGQYYIELEVQPLKILRVVVAHQNVDSPRLADVLRKHISACTHGLIAQKDTALRQGSQGNTRLAAWGRTEVEYKGRLTDK